MFPVRGLADTLVQDGRNRVEIRDVKKWRMYSVSITKFVLYSSCFTAFYLQVIKFSLSFVFRRFQPGQATRESSR